MITTELEILLVEDTRSDAELIIRAIRKGRVSNSILHLQDGKEALDFLFGSGEFKSRDLQQKPRVILLDLKMPRVGGIEVLRQLKLNDLTRQIPIVILTSSKENPDVQQCYELGANSFIVKPVDFDDFMQVVSNLGIYWINQNQSPG